MTEQLNLQSIRQLNVLIKISQSIIRTLDYEKVLQIISDGMSELLEIETAAIYMLRNNREIELTVTTPPLAPDMPDMLRVAPLTDHPHIEKVIKLHKPLLLEDAKKTQLSAAEKKVVEMRQLRSLLYLPFIQEDSILGVLILGTCNKSKLYTDHEINFGQTIANQLSVAIENTRLHADLKEHNDNLEKLVKNKTEDLDTVIEELQATNEELYEKNEIINNKNIELTATLQYLKETQSQLLQAEKMASLGTLTAGVAHEINNPLNYLMGAYQGLKQHFIDINIADGNIDIFLNAIKVAIERTSNIVKGLNQFSRDSDNLDEDCQIHSIIDNCLLMLNNKIKNKIEVSTKYDEKDLVVKGNIGKLHQVFLNIFNNAIYAVNGEGKIEITAKKNKEEIVVEVSDNGQGIQESDIDKITDPFFTTKPPGDGTGLGLSITYSIIKDHKGEINFRSQVNKGTKVIVNLPLRIEK